MHDHDSSDDCALFGTHHRKSARAPLPHITGIAAGIYADFFFPNTSPRVQAVVSGTSRVAAATATAFVDAALIALFTR